MAKTESATPLSSVVLDPSSRVPLYQQLSAHIRALIASGQLPPGTRLQATRTLARDLAVSRTTVLRAYESLCGDGYLDGRVGAGTVVSAGPVSRSAPARRLRTEPSSAATEPCPDLLSRRGESLAATPFLGQPLPVGHDADGAFRPGVPALDAQPLDTWRTLLARRSRTTAREIHAAFSAAGYLPLRQALAAYVGITRGISCAASQIIVTGGAQEALLVLGQLLIDHGDRAWIEDPGYLGARGALLAAGADLVPVPVDAGGVDVASAARDCPQARLAYVTPATQCPLGVTMSQQRRHALLDWANDTGAWIVEDDYDGDYAREGPAVPALQALDGGHRVIYVGTFSKLLFPSLRLGFIVAPPQLAGSVAAGRRFLGGTVDPLAQAVLRDFLSEGHFGRHMHRMRALYAERRSALVTAVARELPGVDVVSGGGLHLTALLPPGLDDVATARAAARHRVSTVPLSMLCLRPPARGGLVLGYANVPRAEISGGVRRLRRALGEVRLSAGGRPGRVRRYG